MFPRRGIAAWKCRLNVSNLDAGGRKSRQDFLGRLAVKRCAFIFRAKPRSWSSGHVGVQKFDIRKFLTEYFSDFFCEGLAHSVSAPKLIIAHVASPVCVFRGRGPGCVSSSPPPPYKELIGRSTNNLTTNYELVKN